MQQQQCWAFISLILVPLLPLCSIFWGTSSAWRYKAEGEQRGGTARSLSDPVGGARGRLAASIRSLVAVVEGVGGGWRREEGGGCSAANNRQPRHARLTGLPVSHDFCERVNGRGKL